MWIVSNLELKVSTHDIDVSTHRDRGLTFEIDDQELTHDLEVLTHEYSIYQPKNEGLKCRHMILKVSTHETNRFI